MMENEACTTENIPATLMQRYQGKGHHLFIDNYYTSINLAKHLLQHDTHVTGTIRDNRKYFSVELKKYQSSKGGSSLL